MNDRYNRWQGFQANQLGVCVSLFLTFSIATLGFSINLLVQPLFSIVSGTAKSSFGLSLFIGLLSIFFGAWVCVNRLRDFRLTAKIVRLSQNAAEASNVAIMRHQAKRLGKLTWGLFNLQLLAFAFQVATLVLALVITYGYRLI